MKRRETINNQSFQEAAVSINYVGFALYFHHVTFWSHIEESKKKIKLAGEISLRGSCLGNKSYLQFGILKQLELGEWLVGSDPKPAEV